MTMEHNGMKLKFTQTKYHIDNRAIEFFRGLDNNITIKITAINIVKPTIIFELSQEQTTELEKFLSSRIIDITYIVERNDTTLIAKQEEDVGPEEAHDYEIEEEDFDDDVDNEI